MNNVNSARKSLNKVLLRILPILVLLNMLAPANIATMTQSGAASPEAHASALPIQPPVPATPSEYLPFISPANAHPLSVQVPQTLTTLYNLAVEKRQPVGPWV